MRLQASASVGSFKSGPRKFVSRQHTVHTWLMHPNIVRGISLSKTLNGVFTRPMALSTCMRTAAIFCVSRTSACVKCVLLPLNGGMFKMRLGLTSRSCMSNPLSAMTRLRAGTNSSKERIPLSMTSWRSLIKPVYSWLTKVNVTFGAMPTNPFTVVWLL